MKRFCLALVGSAMLLATPATAQSVLSGGFATKGECAQALSAEKWNTKKGFPSIFGSTIPATARCEKVGNLYYIVA